MAENFEPNNNRDLVKYLEDYQVLPFEPVQEVFRRKKLINEILKFPSGHIVEVGSGRKSVFSEFSPAESGTVIEPIEKLLEEARSGVMSPHLIKFFNGTLNKYLDSNSAGKADSVIVSSLLHEMEDSASFLKDCRDITAIDGRIIIIVPNKKSIHRILGTFNATQVSLDSKTVTEELMQQHSGAYSMEQLVLELENSGFSVDNVETFFPKLLPHSLMQDALDSSVINVDFLKMFDELIKYIPEFGSEIIITGTKVS